MVSDWIGPESGLHVDIGEAPLRLTVCCVLVHELLVREVSDNQKKKSSQVRGALAICRWAGTSLQGYWTPAPQVLNLLIVSTGLSCYQNLNLQSKIDTFPQELAFLDCSLTSWGKVHRKQGSNINQFQHLLIQSFGAIQNSIDHS